MDPYYNQTHYWGPTTPSLCTPQWQPPSAPSMLSSQWQPSSAPSLCTPQWGPTSEYQPPVVLTPVHSVGSERNVNDLATKIQRVARGFLVRKIVKKMLKIKVELEEIKKKVNDEETVKMIKEVQMERIKIDESLTSLLLRLDSVRVFGCSVLRGFRRSLVKRAFFLQECVDQIQMVDEENEDGEDGKCVRAATKIQMVARGYLVRKGMKKMLKMKVELEEIEKKVNNEETVKIMKKEQEEKIGMNGAIIDLLLRLDSVKVFQGSPLRDLRKSLINRAIVLDEFVDQIETVGPAYEVEDVKEDEDEDEEMTEVEESVESCLVEEGDGYGEIDSEMLTRMMDENREMLRRIMDDSEKQTSVLASLTQRVEQLERAFTWVDAK